MNAVKVYSDTGLLATVANSTAASLVATVSNTTAACLLSVVSNTTASCLLSTVANTTAACLLSVVSNTTASCLLSTVANTTAACLLSLVSQTTASCLLMTNGARTTVNQTQAVTSASSTFARGTSQTLYGHSSNSFIVMNTSATATTSRAKVQLSPDGTNWLDDPTGTTYVTIAQNGLTILTPGKLAQYAALAYATDSDTNTVAISIWYQAHV